METLEKNNIKSIFLQHFSQMDVSGDASRTEALEKLMHLSAPSTKNEFWKYTRVNKLLKADYRIPQQLPTFDKHMLDQLPLNRNESILVFVDGFFSKEHSKIVNASVDFIPFSDEIVQEKYQAFYNKLTQNNTRFFDAINTTFHNSGYILGVPSLSNETVQIVHLFSQNQQLITPRNLILVDTGAKITIKEFFIAESQTAGTFTNQLSEIILMPNSIAHHLQYQHIAENALIYSVYVLQNQDSIYNGNVASFRSSFIRNNLTIQSAGENTQTTINGATVTQATEHIDQHIFIDHQQPGCYSNQLFRTIADDKSTAVFNGKVLVRQDAQKINAFQSNANILLSDFANIYAKPELEIYADDVKCSHGSSTGQLDEEALFYLRARGIREKAARKLLITAFLNDTLENIDNENYQLFLSEEIEHLLQ